MIKAIWCYLFHERYIRIMAAGDDWVHFNCSKCKITWPEKRK